jgi:hypothetical protein
MRTTCASPLGCRRGVPGSPPACVPTVPGRHGHPSRRAGRSQAAPPPVAAPRPPTDRAVTDRLAASAPAHPRPGCAGGSPGSRGRAPLACRDSQRIASRHRIDPARGDSRAAAGHRVRSLVLAVRRSADAHPTQRHRRARLRSRAWPLRLPTGTVRRASAPIAAKSSPEYSSSSERPDGDPRGGLPGRRAHRRSGVGNQPSAGRAQAPPPRPRPRCALV